MDDGDKYPLAAEVIMSDIYMDDLTDADNLESGRRLQVLLVSMLRVLEWNSTCGQLVIHYYYQTQCVKLRTSLILLLPRPRPLDSCGSHIRISLLKLAKILLQSFWQLKVDWNDPLPSNLVSFWKSFIDALESINCLNIPCYCLQDKSYQNRVAWLLSDSSDKAYVAALYLRCINTSGQISVRLLRSKSKIAPLKSITIPQLELCDAVLLSKLLKRTLKAFKVNISQIYLWTDSSIVLAWIKKPLAQLKTFVRNRVNIIQEFTESNFWKHVNSENNPADILSREDDLFLQELKETSDFPLCALLKSFESLDIISNCSSFTKLQKVIAWFKRFIENARHPMSRTMGPLKSAEATLANIKNSFWIPSARNIVRKILRTCITCRKVNAKGSQQLMADLPAARVTACRVFSQVVKAIHLEIVSDLTTEAFLEALKRFVARRGRPIEIYSDNSRNFVGANNELRKILKALFKVGSSLVAVPDPDYTEIPMNRLSRWQLVQRMNHNFWRKWSSEYLNRLQQRPKWCGKGKDAFWLEDCDQPYNTYCRTSLVSRQLDAPKWPDCPVSTDNIVAAYRAACWKQGVKPLQKVLQQLQNVQMTADLEFELNLKGENLDAHHCEALEEIFKRLQFRSLLLENSNLDDEVRKL
ncbi:integrase catalytic domain-containing protein [Trichonephila clavipes]|nr:integrase catalytic domain-containing protein [Trichonephila clavipes]